MSDSDAILARELARAAGEVLVALRGSGAFCGAALGAAGDAVSHALLAGGLAGACPEDGLLSEESGPDPRRLGRARVWIVDPLDGTREYREGRGDWAVHVALCEHGVPAAAAVALPARGRVFSTEPAEVVAAARARGAVRIAVSRTRPPAQAGRVAAAMHAELVPMGSAGAKAMAVLTGEVDAYLHAGGQYEWDSAAPAGVALAAGLHASRIDGSPLRYNRPDPALPDLLVCRAELAGPLLAALAEAGTVAG